MSKYLRVSENIHGRDFICSDIHGHFELLESHLERVLFDPDKDRVFSLGDLVDRGPNSSLAIHYLKQPWFYAILGNHEAMLIDAVQSSSLDSMNFWRYCGGQWAKDIDELTLNEMANDLISLPLAIELEIKNKRSIALVHASLPRYCDWFTIVKHLNALATDTVPQDSLSANMIWEKSSHVNEESLPEVANIQHVFHGHTIKTDYTTINNRTFMDLGSYITHTIGFVEPNKFIADLDSNCE